MSEPILTDDLTVDEISEVEAIAEGLAKKYNVAKVHAYIGVDPVTKERVIGYMKEPNYPQKIFTLDKIASVGIFAAGDELREVLTLREESDPRTYGTSSNCDGFRLGMTGACVPIVNLIQNSFKKK